MRANPQAEYELCKAAYRKELAKLRTGFLKYKLIERPYRDLIIKFYLHIVCIKRIHL